MSKPPGYFLIRVSESRIGYSLSYRQVFAGLKGALFQSLHSRPQSTVESPILFILLNIQSLTLSAEDRCRHFMIDVLEDGHYTVVGESRRHRFLQDLVDFHRRAPIIPFNEVLTVACGQVRLSILFSLFTIFSAVKGVMRNYVSSRMTVLLSGMHLQLKMRHLYCPQPQYLLDICASCKKKTITNCCFSPLLSDHMEDLKRQV